MWDKIKKAAASVYNTVKNVIKPVTSNPVVKSVVNNTVKAVQNSPAAKVVKATVTNTANVVKQQQAAAQARAVSNAQAQAAQQAILGKQRAEAAARAAQQAKANSWLGKIKQGANFVGHAVTTPTRYYDAWKQKQWDAEQIQRQQNQISGDVWAWRKNANVVVAAAGKKLANGEISSDQYDAVVNAERSKMERKAQLWNDYQTKSINRVQAPIPQGKYTKGFVKAMDAGSKGFFGSNLWKYTLGSGSKNVPSLMTALRRAEMFAKKSQNKDFKTYSENDPSTGYTNEQYKNDWKKQLKANAGLGLNFLASQRAIPKFMTDYIKNNAWKYTGFDLKDNGDKQSALKRWQDTYNQVPFKDTGIKGIGTNIATDPINYLPNGMYSALKGAIAPGAAKVTAKISKWAPTVAKGAKWLNADVKSKSTIFVEKLIKQSDKETKGFTPSEIQVYQTAMRNGGVIPKNASGAWTNVNIKKVADLVSKKQAEYNKYYQKEIAKGLDYQKRYGYFPSKRQVESGISRGDLSSEWTPFFTKSKKIVDKSFMTQQELSYADAMRKWAHLKATGKLPKNYVSRALNFPTKAWKAAVLPLRPAWYAYNAAWNLPASFMAGGWRTGKGYGRIFKAMAKEKTFNPEIMKSLPKAIVGEGLYGAEGQGSKLYKVGRGVENISRGAGFLGAWDKTKDLTKSVGEVNKYMFDYGVRKNWERPIRAAVPFWSWIKNIYGMTAKLPLEKPRWAQAFRQVRKETMEKPLAKIPNTDVSYTDPETGKEVTYNPQDMYRGKMNIGGKWRTTPFLPIMPEQLGQAGFSPWLTAAKSFITGKNFYGDTQFGKNPLDLLAGVFPQWELGKAAVRTIAKNPKQQGITEGWVTPSGYTKQRQGYDPSKPNYTASLDPAISFKKLLSSYVGIGNWSQFDAKAWREKQNYYAFSKEYFGTDWYKAFPDYNKREAARQAMATRYGYDMQKDLYDGKWKQYDTPETAADKEQKKAARDLEQEVYNMYNKLPKGTGERSKLIQLWKTTMANTDLLNRMPDFNVFKNVPISGKLADFGGKPATTKFGTSKSYAQSAKAAFWSKYYATTDKAARRKMLAANPQYNSYKQTESQKKIAWAYDNLPPDVRKNWLKKEGLTDPTKANWTDAQWKDYLAKTGNTTEDKLGRDLMSFPGLAESQLAKINTVLTGFNPVRKPTNKTVTMTQNKWKSAYRKKGLTFKA